MEESHEILIKRLKVSKGRLSEGSCTLLLASQAPRRVKKMGQSLLCRKVSIPCHVQDWARTRNTSTSKASTSDHSAPTFVSSIGMHTSRANCGKDASGAGTREQLGRYRQRTVWPLCGNGSNDGGTPFQGPLTSRVLRFALDLKIWMHKCRGSRVQYHSNITTKCIPNEKCGREGPKDPPKEDIGDRP